MNSTVWHTLTGFVLYLGSSGKCKIDQGEKGWYIQYIDKEEEMRRGKILKRQQHEKDEEERNKELLERQIQRALEKEKEAGIEHEEDPKSHELIRENNEEKIKMALPSMKLVKKEEISGPVNALKQLDKEKPSSSKRPSSSKSDGPSIKKSALDIIREEEERYKERKNKTDYWVTEGIIVKVMTKKLGSEYYKAKGEIIGLVDKYTAKVDIDGDILKLDQQHLETVIPAIGKDMLIVNGAYRGTKATLLEIKEEDFSVVLKLKEGLRHGREVTVPYEYASKLA